MNKTIIVTGGCGYIGGQSAITLSDLGYQVIVIDKKIKKLNTDKPITYLQIDLRDKASLNQLDEYDFDAVLHFAAFIEVGLSTKDPIGFYQNNVAGSLNLLDYMQKREVKNLVFSSTAASYGNPPQEVKNLPLPETLTPTPINPYGTSKVIVETVILELQKYNIINPVIFRYFNASGADMNLRHGEEHEPETHLIPLIFDAANKKRDNIKVFGTDYPTKDGTCIRDYIHIQDLADAHVLAVSKLLEDKNFVDPIFNLGNGYGYSVKEVIESVKNITGKDFEIVVEGRRDGDPAILVADNTKAKSVLGFEPKYSSLENIVKSHMQYLENKK